MSITRATLRTKAQSVAQDPANTAKLLLTTPGDYDNAIDQALDTFKVDRPNRRVYHYTAVASTFRFVLLGSGAILPTSGLDKWIDGASRLDRVFVDYDVASDQNEPLERTQWRQRREPGPKDVLELNGIRPGVGRVLALEYFSPYQVHESTAAETSVLEGDQIALITLVAYHLCAMTSRRYVQNTGTSAFQNESVDRRTQSDIMASRAKELLARYGEMVGKGGGAEAGGSMAAAGIARRLSYESTGHRMGRLWPH